MDTASYIQLYLDEKRWILDHYPIEPVVRAAEMVFRCYENGRTLFLMGNGGNAGTIDHLFCDFKHHPFVSEDKRKPISRSVPRLNVVNLCASASELTGLVNDFGAEWMFAAALEPTVKEQDLVIGLSGSGNSENVLRAFEVATKLGAKTIGITKGDGGKMKALAHHCITIPGTSRFPGQTGKNDNNFHFEDEVLSIHSMIVGLLKEQIHQWLLRTA